MDEAYLDDSIVGDLIRLLVSSILNNYCKAVPIYIKMNYIGELFITTIRQKTRCPLCKNEIRNSPNGLLFHCNCGIMSLYIWTRHFFDDYCYFSKRLARAVYTAAEYQLIADVCVDTGYQYFITTEKIIVLRLLEYFIYKSSSPTLLQQCAFIKKYNSLERLLQLDKKSSSSSSSSSD